MRGVLALDIATTTGWALHKPDMQRPFFGAIRMSAKADELGPQLLKLDEFLEDQFSMHGPVDVVMEAQHIGRPGRVNPKTGKAQMGINPQTLKRLISLYGHVEYWVARTNRRERLNTPMQVWEAHISTWRKHFLGSPSNGGTWKKKDVKPAAIATCARYGFHTDIADAAEAIGILDYFLSLRPEYPRPWRDAAMFGGLLR